MNPALDAIRDCLEGAVPAVIATCAPDGTPNVAYLSQVEYVDGTHVALSFQFFNKTRDNILANPHARLLLTHPASAQMYRLTLEYLRTEAAGPLFERMKAKLAGIASHTGMSGVFRLLGSDIYRVHAIEQLSAQLPPSPSPPPSPRRSLLPALRTAAERLGACSDLEGLLEETLTCLATAFDIPQAMLLMADTGRERLYTVASRGYENSGIGAEIGYGEGVIGVAARERTPIRIGHMTAEYSYGRAIREAAVRSGYADRLETEIPLPGLPESRSQLAVPILARGHLLGVLYMESPQDLRFTYDDEDALVALAAQLGLLMCTLQDAAETPAPAPENDGAHTLAQGSKVAVRYYAENSSIFLDGDYLIKGVAGSILWTLLQDYANTGRASFTNRELRLDRRIRLPDLRDNREARLILLARRLLERGACVRIEKTGRGRFRLAVSRPLGLLSIGA